MTENSLKIYFWKNYVQKKSISICYHTALYKNNWFMCITCDVFFYVYFPHLLYLNWNLNKKKIKVKYKQTMVTACWLSVSVIIV